jgi:hypothetical protein
MNRPVKTIFLLLLIAVAGAALHYRLKGTWTPWDDVLLPRSLAQKGGGQEGEEEGGEKDPDLIGPMEDMVQTVFDGIDAEVGVTKQDVQAWYRSYIHSEYHEPDRAQSTRAKKLCWDLLRALRERETILAEKETIAKRTIRTFRDGGNAAHTKAHLLAGQDRRWEEYVKQIRPRSQRDIRALRE